MDNSKMDDKVNINNQITVTDVNDELDSYLTYADLLLKHSRNLEIGLSEGRLISSDENYFDYYFDIGLDTYKKLKSIRSDCKFEYGKREYACSIPDLKKDHVKISISGLPTTVDTIQNGAIVVNLRFIIEWQKKELEKLSLPKFKDRRNTILGNVDISGGCFIECDFKSLAPNEKQKIAIQHAVGVRDIYLIWGPPGTGKTTIVPDIVRNYIRVQKEKGNSKPRVLVCSYTNTAVDNIAKKLFDDFKSMIVRFGKSTTLKGKYKEICLENIIKEKIKIIDKELAERTNVLEKKRKEIEDKITQNSKKLRELNRHKSLIPDKVNKARSEISRIGDRLAKLSENVDSLEKEKQDNANLIQIVEVYMEASKKNRISALFSKTMFKWRDPLYNKYDREIKKLKIEMVNFRELDSLCTKLIVERDDIQKRITETKDELKEIKEERKKKIDDLSDLEAEHTSLKKESLAFNSKLKKENKASEIIRKSLELLKSEIEKKKDTLSAQILHGRTIIATTNMMACDRKLHDITFDLVIMDESGAIDLLGAVIPLLKTNKVVFLGDHKQLPPIVKTNNEIENFLDEHPELEKSIFERFYERCSDKKNKDMVVMLGEQYRMRKEISDFVSDTFYENELEHGEFKDKYSLNETDDPILDSRHPMLCLLRSFHTKYKNKSGYCIGELRLIKHIIENFRSIYGKDIIDKIAVITPFRAQADRIKNEISCIECGTVHTFQGQEKEIIIYSTVKYRPNSDGTFGKLLDSEKSKRLLNVAISRAREKFIVIGCRELFNNVKFYDKLYDYIVEHGGVIKRKLRGYDEQNACKSCGKNIDDKYEYCYNCRTLERERTFLEDKPRTFKAMDGDPLRSSHEVRIDDWFYNEGIEHIVEKVVPIPDRLMYCDWFLPKKDRFIHDIYVEYWGVENKDYEKVREIKEKLYRKHKLTLLSIEVDDMKALDEILEFKLKKYLAVRKR